MYVQVDGGARRCRRGAASGSRASPASPRSIGSDGVVGLRGGERSGPGPARATSRARWSTAGWGLLELRPVRMSLEDIFLQLTTEEPVRGGDDPMTNILAIVRKEWRGYFASPIGYVVIGMYALVFGYFYTVGLQLVPPAEHAGPQMGGGPMNVNQQMIRDVFDELDGHLPVRGAAHHDADLRRGEAVGHDRAADDLADHGLPDRDRASSWARCRSTRRCWASR